MASSVSSITEEVKVKILRKGCNIKSLFVQYFHCCSVILTSIFLTLEENLSFVLSLHMSSFH